MNAHVAGFGKIAKVLRAAGARLRYREGVDLSLPTFLISDFSAQFNLSP
jgi:hypothetical protein